MSKLFCSGTATARSLSTRPSRRNSSIERPLVMSILGCRVVPGLRSTSMQRTPSCARVRASVMPTGPPPAIRTGTCFKPVFLGALRGGFLLGHLGLELLGGEPDDMLVLVAVDVVLRDIEVLQNDLSAQHLLLPHGMLGFSGMKLRHHLAREK